MYQWERIEDAKAFYSGPWLDGIVQRYGMKPQIEFYEVFAITDNARDKVELFKEVVRANKLRTYHHTAWRVRGWASRTMLRKRSGS